MSPLIRPAQPADAAALIALHQQLAATPYMLLTPTEAAALTLTQQTDFLHSLQAPQPTHGLLVAEVSGQIVGLLGYSRHPQAKLHHLISRVALGIAPAHQRQGLGTALLQAAEAHWRHSGITRVEFTCVTTNHPALQLYQRLGYQREGERRQSLRQPDGTYANEFYLAKLL